MLRMVPYYRQSNLVNLFDEFDRAFFSGDRREVAPFRTDVRDEGDHYLLQADLPGFKKEDIDLDVKEGVLTISAKHEEDAQKESDGYLFRERRVGQFSRTFNLSGIEEENIGANYENGVLSLRLPKVVEVQPLSRKIAIQ